MTLTAPGAASLPWDLEVCGHADSSGCSGDLGCKVDRFDAALWNGQAPRAWNDFVTDLRRLLGVDVQYFGSWETQGRGMLHRHVLLWAVGVSESRMRVHVKHLALKHGFGRQIDVQAISGTDARQLARKAGYIASYVSKGSERALCLNRTTGEFHVDGKGYRAWSASRRWGETIAAIKGQRKAYMALRADASDEVGGAAGAEGALDLESQIYAHLTGLELLLRTHLGAQLV